MIQQTESKYKAIRGYGCLMMVYAWLVGMKYKHDFTMSEIESCYDQALIDGCIITDDKPTDNSQGDWHRCWIENPVKWMKILAKSIGFQVYPMLLYKVTNINHPKARYIVYENISVLKNGFGTHFTGEFGSEEYNPDVKINMASIKSIRGWSL